MKEIRIGAVGTGFITSWFCHAARAVEGVRVFAICSRSEERGRSFAEERGIPLVYRSLPEMLEARQIDAVYIASPILCHAEQSAAALRAGCAVLCEKMIAADLAEFSAMERAARESGRVLMEAMRPAFDPAFAILRAALPRVGPVRRADLHFCQYSSRYDAFLAGERPNAFDPALKNSALADIGIYPLHICVSLFGEPERVRASSVVLSNGFEGAGCALLDYSGMSATISYSKIHDAKTPSVIEGERGALVLDRPTAPTSLTFVGRDGVEEPIPLPPSPVLPPDARGASPMHGVSYANMVYEIAAFRDAIAGRSDHRRLLSLTAAVMRTVERIREAQG